MEILEGYQRLFEQSGYFKVQEDQICVDKLGNVKVWVNSDLSKNYSDCQSYDSQQNRPRFHEKNYMGEATMVE